MLPCGAGWNPNVTHYPQPVDLIAAMRWRTHSCVQGSHSCERVLAVPIELLRYRASKHANINAAECCPCMPRRKLSDIGLSACGRLSIGLPGRRTLASRFRAELIAALRGRLASRSRGFSVHNSKPIDLVERQNWDIDFYMTDLYYLRAATLRRTMRTCLCYNGSLPAGAPDSPKENVAAFKAAFPNIKPRGAIIR